MKILGTGIDIIETKRIKKVIASNKTFLKRVFTVREIDYCEGKANKFQHYAVRFAAKEAILKALGSKGIALIDISIKNLDNGKPEAVLSGKLKNLGKNIVVSLSHCNDYAVAQAIYYSR
ncbi:MAG: holo-ACP synthase [bacterium]|nr:holo-ACP synthase [bacterium]MDD5353779.1 holo-ACP synthase [bacterium]MDD5756302.1 holo-ACP synthase [bacterium]